MIDWSAAPTLSFGICTGTVIAPRVVLFAAHCVGGFASGNAETFGTGANKNMVFGFNNNNLPALRRYVGLDPSPVAVGQTNVADKFYRVVDVIVHPRNADNSFIAGTADVALAILDKPIEGFDGHAMLFSQLSGLENVEIAGYGRSGTASTGQSVGVDWWRRAGGNALSGLLSDNQVFGSALFGSSPPIAGYNGANYWLDCDSATVPRPAGDFNVFGGAALSNEACIAQGDSGGAMWITRGGQKVAIGVASYGYSTGPSFGQGSFTAHTALFPYWDFIVANNAYVYANAKVGGGAWENATTWTQALNPNYYVLGTGGALVNALPTTDPASNTGPFTSVGSVRPPPVNPVPNSTAIRVDIDGNVISDENTTGDGRSVLLDGTVAASATATGGESNPDVLPHLVPDPAVGGIGSGFWPTGTAPLSGAGSTNFVPNNIDGTPGVAFVNNARYYEVQLINAGTVTLSSARTIDRLGVSGSTLQINAGGGDLTTLMASTVASGNLTVNGTFRARGLTLSGGRIQGTGNVIMADTAALSAASSFLNVGGTVAPGNSIGTLNVIGNFVQGPGGLLEIEVTNGSADRVAVTGNAILGGTVSFQPFGPSPLLGQSYDFVTTTGTVVGTFSSVQDFLPGTLFPIVTYGSNFARVTIGNLCSFADGPVDTPICNALSDPGVQGDPDMIPAISGIQSLANTPGALSAAMKALNPTRAHAQALVGIQTGDLLRNQLGRRSHDLLGGAADAAGTAMLNMAASQLASADPSADMLASAAAAAIESGDTGGGHDIKLANGNAVFFAGDVGLGNTDQPGGIGKDQADVTALTVGFDHAQGNYAIGVAASYLQSQVAQDYGFGGDTSSEGAAFSGFANVTSGRFYADGYVSYAWHDFETSRRLLVAPSVFATAEGTTNATQSQAGVTAGYRLLADEMFKVGAVGGLYYINMDIDGYTETGAGPLSAILPDRSIDSLRSQLGGEVAVHVESGNDTLVPLLRVVWNHEFEDEALVLRSAFAGAPAVTFTTPGSDLGSDWATVGVGVTGRLKDGMSFYFRYQHDLGREGQENQEVSGAMRFAF